MTVSPKRSMAAPQIIFFFIVVLFCLTSFFILVKQQVELFNRLQKYDTSKQSPNRLIFKEIDLTFEVVVI